MSTNRSGGGSQSVAAWMLAALLAGPVALGQAPGSGDPSFPKDTPPPPSKPPSSPPAKPVPDDRPNLPGKTSPPTGDPRSAMGLIDLRPKFRAGQETRYTLKMSSENFVTPAGGQPGEPASRQDMTQEIGFVLRVKEAGAGEAGGAVVEMVYERVKIGIKTPDAEISWDSTAPPRPNDDSDILGPFFKSMIGAKMTIRFDATGNITGVEGGNELALPGMMGQAGIDPKSIGSLFGPIRTDASGKGLYRVGERWTNADTVDTGPLGRFRMVTQHTLAGARAGHAEVHFDGRIEPGSEAGTPGSPFKVSDARTRGKYGWDTELGQLRSMESEQDVTIDPGSAGRGGGLKAKTTVRVERDAPVRSVPGPTVPPGRRP